MGKPNALPRKERTPSYFSSSEGWQRAWESRLTVAWPTSSRLLSIEQLVEHSGRSANDVLSLRGASRCGYQYSRTVSLVLLRAVRLDAERDFRSDLDVACSKQLSQGHHGIGANNEMFAHNYEPTVGGHDPEEHFQRRARVPLPERCALALSTSSQANPR